MDMELSQSQEVSLPTHVLEMIFAYVPIQDLVQSVRLVSKSWKHTFDREGFLKNRKRYHHYRLKDEPFSSVLEAEVELQLKNEVPEIANESSQGSQSSVLLLEKAVPMYLKKTYQGHADRRFQQDAMKSHRNYPMAKSILEQQFLNYSDSVSCLAITTCVVSRTLDDFQEICRLLTSSADFIEASEFLYALATFFLYLERKLGAPLRLHYMLTHALILAESAWTLDVSSNSAYSLPFTPEQKRIIHYPIDLRSNGTVKIVAFAGTGKTTTLIHLCRRNPSLRFLLVVFNKSVQEYSERAFPGNVICKTANSLSYRFLMEKLQYPKSRFCTRVKADEFMSALPRKGPGSGNIFRRCAQILATIYSFCNSVDDEITLLHVPEKWPSSGEVETIEEKHRLVVYEDACMLWKDQLTNKRSLLKVDNTMGLKMFQLSKPNLRKTIDFDVLLLDEGQDLNPATLDICLKQPGPKFIVGDPLQQIYSFNGAVNGLDRICNYSKIDATLYLTRSFRFGPEIAFTASAVAQKLQGETKRSVTSSGIVNDNITGVSMLKDVKESRTAILARTNARLFDEIVDLLCLKAPTERPIIALPGKMRQSYNYLRDLSYFYQNKKNEIKIWYSLKKYNSFSEYKEKMKNMNDVEALSKVEIVTKYGDKVPEYVDIIQQSSSGRTLDCPEVQYVFSTVHQVKGLEFPRVILLDDFYMGQMPHSVPKKNEQNIDEFNLLYVALTRAQFQLVLNDSLFFLLTGLAKENFECLEACDNINERCLQCRMPISTDFSVRIRQLCVVTSGKRHLLGGNMCTECAFTDFIEVDNAMTLKDLSSQTPLTNRNGILLRGLMMHNAKEAFRSSRGRRTWPSSFSEDDEWQMLVDEVMDDLGY